LRQPGRRENFYHCRPTARRPLLIGIFTLPLLLLLVGCLSGRGTEKEDTLTARVKGFWDARVAGDGLQSYAFEAYSKTGEMTATQYINSLNPTLRYKAYDVQEIEEKGEEATVNVGVKYQVILPTRANLDLSMKVKDRWVKLDGQWYRRQKDKLEDVLRIEQQG
jgi:hypothetical protein